MATPTSYTIPSPTSWNPCRTIPWSIPGHEYIVNNLRFTLDREPGNAAARTLLDKVVDQDPAAALITTIEQEKAINTFFRLANPEIIEKLHEVFPDLPARPDAKTVFLKLRELRNRW